MSNTVIILANAYEEFCNDRRNINTNGNLNGNTSVRWQELRNFISSDIWILVMFILAIISLGIFITGSIFKWSISVMLLGIIGYIIGLVGLVLRGEKNEVKNYRGRRTEYYKKLREFNNILKHEFEIDSKEKIEYILKNCDETSNSVGQDLKIVGQFVVSWQKIIYPVIMVGIGIIVSIDTIKKSLKWEDVTMGLTVLFSIFIMIVILLKMVQSVIEPFINSNKNRVNTLKCILNDINLKEYV
ncbi:hypothetical protein [Clostridium gasigenes]|uniref:hypothetical protein n=1 Tax=Clostridium gasigenes TaxID=94869 RepID=UPI001C0B8C77|nr:hypothetical protein [Clostridium gasigenes]MBU3103930.1 hypothetical protein [Clostridium gasigenes]